MRRFSERAGDGSGVPVLDAEEGEELMHAQSGVAIALGAAPPQSPGTLYISTKQVVWLSDVDRAKGFAVDFLSISLHAVSRDPEAYPSPCIYTQIETGSDNDESEGSDSESDDVLELSKIKEMRLLPSDPNQLDTLFNIFCECAELNPEPVQGEEGNDWVFSADHMEDLVAEDEDPDLNFTQNSSNTIGHSNGDHSLARSVLELQIDDQRFADAEEMEQDNHSSHR